MSPPSRKRSLLEVLKLFHQTEKSWPDIPTRTDLLAKLRKGLSLLEGVPGIDPHIPDLHKHIHNDIDLPHLCGILVPVEREYEQLNITDDDFLVTTDDRCSDKPISRMPATVILDNIRSAFNIGGIFRSCECLGIERIVLCGYSATPDNDKVSRSAMGTSTYVPWTNATKAEDAVKEAKKRKHTVIALETAASAPTYNTVSCIFPCSVVVGNERFGLGQSLLQKVDIVARIPTYGRKNSLNVVSAFTVFGYELRRQWEKNRGVDDR